MGAVKVFLRRPMKIRVILVGKTKQTWVVPAVEEYRKRCRRYVQFEEVVLPEGKGTIEQVQLKEEKAIEKAIADSTYTILLDERGQEFTSHELAGVWKTIQDRGRKQVCIVVGGAYGLSSGMKQKGNLLVALSKLTFPHQFVRAILYEQLYRAFTILKNEPYHH